ncbi:MAG TPA: hypothetical protein VKK61_12290 [Tepidisphaeraceae bacterium]|nr:hypothetical protein [Tepidisphaeraceae bacterium]
MTAVNHTSHSRFLFGAAAIAMLLWSGGCSSGFGPRVVSNPDPAAKIPAIEASVAAKDYSAVKQMVKDLESDDPAVRFYAINGLQRLTKETFGYQYYANEEQRAPAVEKWKLWLKGWNAGQRDLRK